MIAILDYGMGNVNSVLRALQHAAPSETIELTADPQIVRKADRVVVPGQGALGDCMREIAARELFDAVLAASWNKPYLGICIGMQILFCQGEENQAQGLGILSGTIPRLPAAPGLRIPHVGWNNVYRHQDEHELWAGIQNGTRFYFSHGYYVEPEDQGTVAARCNYGVDFPCAIAIDNIFAVQFHPEKSHSAGLRLLANFAQWRP